MKMKRFTLGLACLSLVAAMSSCSKNAEKATEETAGSEQTVGLKIAYVELDTLMSQYQLYKDYSELLTRKGNNIQNTLAQKQHTLETHAAQMQKKYESNGFTTRDELERAQASIQREQEDLQELAALRLENPECSLRELAGLLSVSISRSGVNHRLKRISEAAAKLRMQEEGKDEAE